jgi:hypothetical protein
LEASSWPRGAGRGFGPGCVGLVLSGEEKGTRELRTYNVFAGSTRVGGSDPMGLEGLSSGLPCVSDVFEEEMDLKAEDQRI